MQGDRAATQIFRQLLDFWVKNFKIQNCTIKCIFLGDHRVLLNPVACGALNLKCAAGGKGHNQLTPRPAIFTSARFVPKLNISIV